MCGTLTPLQLLFRWDGSADESERGQSPHTASHVGYISLVPLRMGLARDATGLGSGGFDLNLQHIFIPGRIGIGIPRERRS